VKIIIKTSACTVFVSGRLFQNLFEWLTLKSANVSVYLQKKAKKSQWAPCDETTKLML